MPALNYLFRNRKEIELVLPATEADFLPMLKSHRFCFWCKPEEANMLIFSYQPSGGQYI
jgi:hypothetical protein